MSECGYYQNFASTVEFHMDEPWYNIRDILRVLKRINKLDLTHPENRYKALCWLNGMDCIAPYGPTCRFPCKDFYVTEVHGCYGEALRQLRKNLANNCFIKFEIGRATTPLWRKKSRQCVDCGAVTKCCPEVEDEYDNAKDCCGAAEPNCYTRCCKAEALPQCPISSDSCDKCLGPNPPSCCPPWYGKCKIKKVRPESYKCYVKSFTELIEKLMKSLEKRECVFTRKHFEKYYRVIWTKYKAKCDILEANDSEDYLCDECCQKEYGKSNQQNNCYQ